MFLYMILELLNGISSVWETPIAMHTLNKQQLPELQYEV